MRILIVGASGTIGTAIVAALKDRHDLVLASWREGPEQVDISDPASIRALYARIGRVDAVVAAAGQVAFKPLAELTDADFSLSLNNKLMGQVKPRAVRHCLGRRRRLVYPHGGLVGSGAARNAAAVSFVNAGLEGFARSVALELPRASASMWSVHRLYPKLCALGARMRGADYLLPMWRGPMWRAWKASKLEPCLIRGRCNGHMSLRSKER